MADKIDNRPCETPLIDRLRNVPQDARLEYKHDDCDYSLIPVGLLCHQAADALKHWPEDRERIAELEKRLNIVGVLTEFASDGLTVVERRRDELKERAERAEALLKSWARMYPRNQLATRTRELLEGRDSKQAEDRLAKLLYEVDTKVPGETRYETAMRWLREHRENRATGVAMEDRGDG